MNISSSLRFPFLCAGGIYILSTALLLIWGLADNGWVFTYPLDDTYIHMAMARNFAYHGVWGATQHQFSASSSSLLWTIMLSACIKLIGLWEWIPLILNFVFSLLIIYWADRLLTDFGIGSRLRLLTLLCLVLITPLPVLTLIGMEHSAHALATMWFLWLAVKLVTTERQGSSQTLLGLVALSAALDVALRVEGIFLVSVACLFLLVRRRYLQAFLIGVSGLLPLLLFGYYSSKNGSYWLPNSILMKGNLPDFTSFYGWVMTLGGRAIRLLFNSINLSMTCLLVSLALLIFRHYRETKNLLSRPNVLGMMVFLITLLHLQYAGTGWLFRYEAYLVMNGLIAIACLISVVLPTPSASLREKALILMPSSRPLRPAIIFFFLVALTTYGARIGQSATTSALWMKDRFQEHILTARFVENYYDRATLVINDLGAMAYFSKARLLDILGLGSIEPVRWRLAQGRGFHSSEMKRWVRDSGAEIAIFQSNYTQWHRVLPKGWAHVCDWRIRRRNIFRDRIVRFYASNPQKARELELNLREFSDRLPEDIVISFSQQSGTKPP